MFNLLTNLPTPGTLENFQTLIAMEGVRIERIVSHSHSGPPGFWYQQAYLEWVLVLQGEAVLSFEDGQDVEMVAGDTLSILPNVRHRVARTEPNTIWLAIHFDKTSSPSVAD